MGILILLETLFLQILGRIPARIQQLSGNKMEITNILPTTDYFNNNNINPNNNNNIRNEDFHNTNNNYLATNSLDNNNNHHNDTPPLIVNTATPTPRKKQARQSNNNNNTHDLCPSNPTQSTSNYCPICQSTIDKSSFDEHYQWELNKIISTTNHNNFDNNNNMSNNEVSLNDIWNIPLDEGDEASTPRYEYLYL